MIPTLSIVFMAISALVSIGLPIALGIIWHKRTGAKASSLFIGAAAFVVFAMILENICHRLVLYGSGSCAAFMQSNMWAYGLYGALRRVCSRKRDGYVPLSCFLRRRTTDVRALCTV